MDSSNPRKEPSLIGTTLGILWNLEKSEWKWAAGLGLIGAVLIAVAAGFFGYLLYGYAGMVAGALLGAILGWIVSTLIVYILLSTASLFG